MQNKIRTIAAVAMGILFFPMAVFALSTGDVDWGLGATVNPDGSIGFSAAVGSPGTLSGGNHMLGGGWALANPYGLPQGSILGILSNLLFWLLAIFAIMGIIGFVISGIFYLLAGADEGNVERGKTGMTYSIVGIIVGLSGFLIMQAVAMLLSGASSKF